MKPVQISGHVDATGTLHLEALPLLPAGEDVRVLIMEASDIAMLEKLIEIVGNSADVDPALVAQLEALDEALWDAQFASSPALLKEFVNQAQQAYERGETLPLDELLHSH